MGRIRGPTPAQTLGQLAGLLSGVRLQVTAQQERNFHLRVRACLLVLLVRARQEVAAHRQRFGITSPPELLAALPGLSGGPSSGSGSTSGDGDATGAEGGGSLSEEDLAAQAAPILARIPHLSQQRSLLGLDEASDDEVAEVRCLTLERARGRLNALVLEGSAHVAGLEAAEATAAGLAAAASCSGGEGGSQSPGLHQQQGRSGAAARAGVAAAGAEAAAARERMRGCGRRLARLQQLLTVWQPQMQFNVFTKNFQTGEPCLGMADGNTDLWERVVLAAGWSREEALLAIDNNELLHARMAAVGAAREALSRELQAAAAAPLDGAAGGVAAAGAADEVVEELEANTRTHLTAMVQHTQINMALQSAEQLCRLYAAAYPYPVNTHCCLKVSQQLMRLRPDEAFPWASEARWGDA
ncbi:MAG: hypothetical protein J3K34DRAFT_425364 [Monoraphidium minutum]|nr:MAG: hypothetical protein J3K34DRAFT_425364 [Monoraphidium minutum]